MLYTMLPYSLLPFTIVLFLLGTVTQLLINLIAKRIFSRKIYQIVGGAVIICSLLSLIYLIMEYLDILVSPFKSASLYGFILIFIHYLTIMLSGYSFFRDENPFKNVKFYTGLSLGILTFFLLVLPISK